jgi:hypothetical protein
MASKISFLERDFEVEIIQRALEHIPGIELESEINRIYHSIRQRFMISFIDQSNAGTEKRPIKYENIKT